MIIKRTFSITALMLAAITSSGCSQPSNSASDATSPKEIWPTIETGIKSDAQMEQKIADMLKSMTLEQKIAQMINLKSVISRLKICVSMVLVLT